MKAERRRMEAELAHLTRRLAERCQVQVVGDEGERAVIHEAHELLSAVHERDRARVHALTEALARMDEAPRRAENRKRGPRRLEIKVLDDELPSDNLSQPSKN